MNSYFDVFKDILLGESVDLKLTSSEINWNTWQPFELPKYPGREKKISFSEEQIKFPKREQLKNNDKKALALHSFANHELLAIEMMSAAILIFPHEDEESIRFKKGILSALKDEQKHFLLYNKRLNELGYEFGDFPVNDFFWRQMEKIKSPSQFMAVMALTFESANLDFAQYYKKLFEEFGDLESARILDVVLTDELAHVALGAHWMKKWKDDKNMWEYYCESLPWPLTAARSRGIGFDPELHHRAIGDDAFIEELKRFDDNFRVTKRGSV